MRRLTLGMAALGSLATLAACGGAGGGGGGGVRDAGQVTPPAPAPVAAVTVTLAEPSLSIGQTTQAVATLRDTGGTVLTGRAVSWVSSDTSVATVGSTGLVTAVAMGSADITGTSEGMSGSSQVAVTRLVIAKIAGENQTAPPGSLLPVAPTVQIQGASGAPIAGVDVTFTVSLGGGAVQIASARTDATGSASCGGWTLGPGKGFHAMIVSAQGADDVTFEAVAASTSPDLTITVISPTPNKVVNDPLPIFTHVTATFQIAAITARLGSAQATLTAPSNSRTAYSGVMVVGDQPRATMALIVSATDVLGHSSDVVIPVFLDRPPALVVSAPVMDSVARPTLHVAVTCTDDDSSGCWWVRVYAGPNAILEVPATSFVGDIDLSAFDGSYVWLRVVVTDSSGQTADVYRRVYVESSPRLAVRAEIDGTAVDALDSRVLFVDAARVLTIVNTETRATQALDSHASLFDFSGNPAVTGHLTPSGAIWTHGIVGGGSDCLVEEWRSGATLEVSPHGKCASLRVAGDWAAFKGPTILSAQRLADLTRRDLVAGVSDLVTSTAWDDAPGAQDSGTIDVATNGDVVFRDGTGGIYLWQSGAIHFLGDGAAGRVVTDGVNHLYSGPAGLMLSDGAHETPLGTTACCGDTAGGHVAFLVPDSAGTRQVWRYDRGLAEQVTFFFNPSRIEAIAPDGTIVLANAQRRYRASPGAALVDIGSAQGRVEVRDGRFVLFLGRAVLDVLP